VTFWRIKGGLSEGKSLGFEMRNAKCAMSNRKYLTICIHPIPFILPLAWVFLAQKSENIDIRGSHFVNFI